MTKCPANMVEWSSVKAPCWESRWIVLFFYFAPELPFCQVAANTACLLGISSDPPLEGLKLGHPSRPRPARRTHHRTSIGAHQSTQGERHDHHRPNHSNETSPDGLTEEDRACRGRALPAHLYLDPDPLSLHSGARSEVHRRPWPGHWRHFRRHPGDDRGPRRHRHRRPPVPGGQEAERSG